MHSPILLAIIVALAGVLVQAQRDSFNSTMSSFPSRNSTVSSRMLRPDECEKKLNLQACMGMNIKETATEAEKSNALKNTVCAAECTNTMSKISREYVEEQCGVGARLSFNFDFLLPVLPALSTFVCTTDSQGNMCTANMMSALMQTGVKPTKDPKTNRDQPVPIEKFPKSFTCSECAAKIQEAAKVADAVTKSKSSPGKTYHVDAVFPYDDASVAARKSMCSADGASATGASNSAGRHSGATASVVAVVAVAALMVA